MKSNTDAIFQQVLVNIKPSPEEAASFQGTVDGFLRKLNAALRPLHAKALLGGSGAKGTWLRGAHDADIFVLFDFQKYAKRSHLLADILEKPLKKLFKSYERLHGSRDYFQILAGGYVFELIPILQIQKAAEALNITDISPLHADWVTKNSDGKLRDDIRLAKQFCRAQKCYGAESYIRGFSGYVLEVLAIHFGGFLPLLQNIIRWDEKKEKEVIDIMKYYGGKKEAFKEMNQSKLGSPFILIDPTDRTRNAAAALSYEKFALFKKKAKEFLESPNAKFFEKEKITGEILKCRYPNSTVAHLVLSSLKGKEDVAGAKLLQAFEALKKKLRPFVLLSADWDWDKHEYAEFWLVLEKKEIEPFEMRAGPPLKLKKYVEQFKKKHAKHEVFEKEGKIWAKVPRKNNKIAAFVGEILDQMEIKEKFEKIIKKEII